MGCNLKNHLEVDKWHERIRSKVDPHCKSYAWVPVLWSFEKLREVGVFSYLIYSLAKSHFNVWEYLEAWMVVSSAPKIGTK